MYTFNIKRDISEDGEIEVLSKNSKEASIQKIEGIDNKDVIDIDLVVPNYRITGEKIGRTYVEAKNVSGEFKNIWIDVVNDESAKSSAKVVVGDGFTLALRADGTVWGFGNINGTSEPEEIKLNEDIAEEIMDISCGKGHVLLLGRSGSVYAFGNNKNGELGTGNITSSKVPKKLQIENIAKIECLDNTSYAITKEGEVYAWGKGYEKIPTLINIDKNFNEIIGEKVEQISKGIDFVAILGVSGKCYLYKENSTEIVETNENIQLEGIKEISAKGDNLILVTKDGNVYTLKENGQAILRDDIVNIERVSIGYNHTAVYDKTGNVYTWGQGESGELGNGEFFTYEEAQRVGNGLIEANASRLELTRGEKFDIDGFIDYFNLFDKNTAEIYYEIIDQDLADIDRETGELTTKANGRTTVIAREVGSDRRAIIPVTIYEKGEVCPQVVTAGGHTLMLKVDGTVWAYGTNENGELGIGNTFTKDEQTKVEFPESVIIKEIACRRKA